MPEPQDWLEAYKNAPSVTCGEMLRREGYEPPPPLEVNGMQLRGRLLELIYALAARRFHVCDTNHLSDRELYDWLHKACHSMKTPDLLPEAGWNCRLEPAGPAEKDSAMTYLRFYADDDERARWAEQFPEDPMPPREVTPYDRDRFLPMGAEPQVEAEGSGLPDFIGHDHEEEHGDPPFDTPATADPLGLDSVDRQIRREQLRNVSEDTVDRPQKENELFERVAKIDQGEWQRPHEELVRSGVVLMPPDELTDETVGPKLWELLHELACRGFYVLNTDHLSDREVYNNLWREDLREPAILPGRSRLGGWFHDFVGSGSEEHTQVWLRYFASDEARARHASQWPKEPMPNREVPQFQRDWRLPKGPF